MQKYPKCKDFVSFIPQVFQTLDEIGMRWKKLSKGFTLCAFPAKNACFSNTLWSHYPSFHNNKISKKEACANMKNQIETFSPSLNSLSTMSPVVFSVLREAPRISVLVRALVQDIKYKPIMLNLEQLFPALKHSLLTFLTASCVFSNTFLCLHCLPFRFSLGASRRIQIGSEARIFCTDDQNKRVSEAHLEEHIPKSMRWFHNWKDIFHHILDVYTSSTSCGLYFPIYSYNRNGSCLN